MTSRHANKGHERPYNKASKNPTHFIIHFQNRVLGYFEIKQKNHYNYRCHRPISKILTPADAEKKDKTWHVITFTPAQIATIFKIQIKFFFFKKDFFLVFITILTTFGYF